MRKEIDKLINEGYSVEEIIGVLRSFQDNAQVRCQSCNSRLCDLDNDVIIIKCKCGEYNQII